MRDSLIRKGLKQTRLDQDPTGMRGLIIESNDGKASVSFGLGYESLEQALEFDLDAREYGNNPLTISLSHLHLEDRTRFLKQLQHFQQTMSHGVDVVYEVLGKNPPSVSLELSL